MYFRGDVGDVHGDGVAGQEPRHDATRRDADAADERERPPQSHLQRKNLSNGNTRT